MLLYLYPGTCLVIHVNMYSVDIDECASVPCDLLATCNNMENMYTCTCAAGYTGVECFGMKMIVNVLLLYIMAYCKVVFLYNIKQTL